VDHSWFIVQGEVILGKLNRWHDTSGVLFVRSARSLASESSKANVKTADFENHASLHPCFKDETD
jgi:ribosomal protein L35AE/L33A